MAATQLQHWLKKFGYTQDTMPRKATYVVPRWHQGEGIATLELPPLPVPTAAIGASVPSLRLLAMQSLDAQRNETTCPACLKWRSSIFKSPDTLDMLFALLASKARAHTAHCIDWCAVHV